MRQSHQVLSAAPNWTPRQPISCSKPTASSTTSYRPPKTLNGRHRDETELQDELLHDTPGLETVEYLETGRPAKLKLPPVAVLTFRTETAAAAALHVQGLWSA